MQRLLALLCQLLAALLAIGLSLGLRLGLAPGALIGLQAVFATLLARLFRQPRWWLGIHLAFAPSLWLLAGMEAPAWLYLTAFLAMVLAFWGTAKGDVPLFLSPPATACALRLIAEREHAFTLVELGAGIGSVVVPLAKRCPSLRITAIEQAPLPWLILRWRCRRLNNVRVDRKNLWRCRLNDYDIAFGFLSPELMATIGAKCRQEMRPGSLFVSAAFEIPDWPAEQEIELPTRQQLYCYRLAPR